MPNLKFLSVILVLVTLSFAVSPATPAFADPPAGKGYKKHQRGKQKNKDRRKHRQKQDRHFQHYKAGGPPPWAPAHGYRYKHGQVYSRTQYRAPFNIDLGRCNRQQLGTALGGLTGGLIGSRVGKGDGRKLAILGGAIIGAIVGRNIGRSMDQLDQACVAQSLEHAPDGQKITWQSPQGSNYQVTPTRTYQARTGAHCREYQTIADLSGQRKTVYGTACRNPDGTWKLMN